VHQQRHARAQQPGGRYCVLTAQPDWLAQAAVDSMVHGVGVPAQVETPTL